MTLVLGKHGLTGFGDDWGKKACGSTLPAVAQDGEVVILIFVLAESCCVFPAIGTRRPRTEAESDEGPATQRPRLRLRSKQARPREEAEDDGQPAARRARTDAADDEMRTVEPVQGPVPEGTFNLDGFNDRPADIPAEIWDDMKRLHRSLGHPAPSSLVKFLKRFRANDMAIAAANALRCKACAETTRPGDRPAVNYKRADKFNQNIFMDVFEVKLPDGSNQLLAMFLDDASRLGYAVPVHGARNISTTAAEQAMIRGWLSWAGPPGELQFDPATAFTSARWFVFVGK